MNLVDFLSLIWMFLYMIGVYKVLVASKDVVANFWFVVIGITSFLSLYGVLRNIFP